MSIYCEFILDTVLQFYDEEHRKRLLKVKPDAELDELYSQAATQL